MCIIPMRCLGSDSCVICKWHDSRHVRLSTLKVELSRKFEENKDMYRLIWVCCQKYIICFNKDIRCIILYFVFFFVFLYFFFFFCIFVFCIFFFFCIFVFCIFCFLFCFVFFGSNAMMKLTPKRTKQSHLN